MTLIGPHRVTNFKMIIRDACAVLHVALSLLLYTLETPL